ncbi:Histone-lysine N-methyltransferase EZH1 [Trichoderma ghanense]|uniref:Histone-lysine N-methyltransferase EZH1 n=1 Tax=Trichoderma ghanense TaxID=65468 RepID=A0ABY2GR71_9HYPO
MMPHGPPRVIATSEQDPSHLARLDLTSGSGVAASTRGPISPPPLRRSCSSAPPAPSSAASPTSAFRTGDTGSSSGSGTWTPAPLPERASVPLTDRVFEHAPEMPESTKPGIASNASSALNMPPATPSRERQRQPEAVQTPKAQTVPVTEWTVQTLAKQLTTFNQQVRKDHAQLVAHAIESARCREWRTQHGLDLFRELQTHPNPEVKGKQIKIKFKQHNKNKKEQKDVRYNVHCVKTNKPAVPSYRFHHVEIKKNVLMPNTMLTFVPHLRDLEGSEEAKYNLWLKELEDIDLKSGFKPMNRDEKFVAIIQGERAATLSLYLDMWLKELNIPSCNKSTLIRYMASHASDDAITPQQKTDIIKSHGHGSAMTPEEHRAAELFTAAFQLAFKENQPQLKQIELRKVLFLDESVDSVMDNKPAAKEVSIIQQDNEDEVVESNLATYCILGCLICFSHSCDHGEYDIKNWKRTFSLSSCAPLSDILRRKRIAAAGVNTIADVPCRRRCYRLKIPPDPGAVLKPWTEDERMLLRTLYITTDFSKTKMDPICLATEFLNRNCDEVYAEFQSLNIGIPGADLAEPPRPRNISWYDRKRKMLIGDWQEHTITHEHQRRELLEPCSHDGPCAPKICSCVDAGVLCERFCGCTEANCAYKFTGCACHSLGKTCLPKQKDRPCICVQLNRECDPQLCGSCGAFERADPANAEDDVLHSSGCQNCDLQRGRHKTLLLGQSQLEGVGYGLFTAEDIAQDEFIVEYVGELITHDEGVRREARRGDVFDETSNISYVFTLLENEGIWVDAAIYGNLSRYINHASEHDTRGCNITPRILYVNGEFRIKFTALRDIKAGEELFFNYGENFPNLTKKLLDNKSGEKPEGPRKVGRPKRAETGDRVARKVPKIEHKKGGRPKSKKKKMMATAATVNTTTTTTVQAAVVAASDDDSLAGSPSMVFHTRKRKRHTLIDSEEEEYHPPGTDAASSAAAAHANTEEGELLGSKRLRKTTRSQRAKEPETTPAKTPGSEEQKPRGKRGGARPGSGRPRKHPRVIPKPSKEPPQPAQAAQPADSSQESQLDANTSASAPTQTPTPTPSTPKQTRTGREEGPEEVVEIEDSEDQDVVTMTRTSRNRRLPAKFREEA